MDAGCTDPSYWGIDTESFGFLTIGRGNPVTPGSQRSCFRQVPSRTTIFERGSRGEASIPGNTTTWRDRPENR